MIAVLDYWIGLDRKDYIYCCSKSILFSQDNLLVLLIHLVFLLSLVLHGIRNCECCIEQVGPCWSGGSRVRNCSLYTRACGAVPGSVSGQSGHFCEGSADRC